MANNIRRYLSLLLSMTIAFFAVLLTVVFFGAYYLLSLKAVAAQVLTVRVIAYLVPQIVCYVIPLAWFCGVGFVVDGIVFARQSYWFLFLHQLQRYWVCVIGVCGVVGSVLLFFCNGWLAPLCYRQAKQEIAAGMVHSLSSLPSNRLHKVGGAITVFFKNRHQLTRLQAVVFDRLFIVVEKGGSERLVITARRAVLFSAKKLVCQQGALLYEKGGSILQSSTFSVLRVPWDYYYSGTGEGEKYASKHLTLSELLNVSSGDARKEVVRRICQCIGVFLGTLCMGLCTGGWHRRRLHTALIPILCWAVVLFCCVQVISQFIAWLV